MKTKINKIGLILMLLFVLPVATFAVSYPLYLCGGATANLKPDPTVEAALGVGDRVMWQEFDASGAPIGTVTPLTVTVAGTAPSFTTISTLSTGEHTYKVFVISASPNTCTGDVSDPFKLYVLPTASVSLGAPSNGNYCEAASGTNQSSVITATATPTIDASLTDVSYTYTWTATKDGSAVTDVTTIGTQATNVFTMNTNVKGSYIFTTAIKYTVASGTLKSADGNGCVHTSAPSTPIVVTPKPGKPTITFS
jgi:hypothetical protein